MTAPPASAVRRMTGADAPAVGELLALSFPDKLRAMLPRRRASAAFLLGDVMLDSGDVWVADDGGIAGVICFQDAGRPWSTHSDWRTLRCYLPLGEAFRAAAFMTVFHAASFPADELYIDTVAVRPAWRRRGVGDALMRFAEAEARRRRRRSLCLYCIRRNTGAHALYLRHGYRVVRSEDLWWCSFVLGFRITDMMRKVLEPA